MRKITAERQARNNRWHFGQEPGIEGGLCAGGEMSDIDIEQRAVEIYAIRTMEAEKAKLEERIQKAREILNSMAIYRSPYVESPYVLEPEIEAVLRALEGK